MADLIGLIISNSPTPEDDQAETLRESAAIGGSDIELRRGHIDQALKQLSNPASPESDANTILISRPEDLTSPAHARTLIELASNRSVEIGIPNPATEGTIRIDADAHIHLLIAAVQDLSQDGDGSDGAQDQRPDARPSPVPAGAPAAGETHHGRPPLGYDVRDGVLAPSDEFQTVKETLHAVADGNMTKSAAAEKLGTTRRTIGRCVDDPDRRDRYGLS